LVGLQLARLDVSEILEELVDIRLVEVLRDALDDYICKRIARIIALTVQDN